MLCLCGETLLVLLRLSGKLDFKNPPLHVCHAYLCQFVFFSPLNQFVNSGWLYYKELNALTVPQEFTFLCLFVQKLTFRMFSFSGSFIRAQDFTFLSYLYLQHMIMYSWTL